MTLRQLEQEGKLRRHRTSKKEILDLFKLIDRDLQDACAGGISFDRKFATAYNAVLSGAAIILYCKGYQSYGKAHHFTCFQAMKIVLGKEFAELADYFDSCRVKRNVLDYDVAGIVSEKEFNELMDEAKRFCAFIKEWVTKHYPQHAQKDKDNEKNSNRR
jgi:uncharacterized protein (UPF0332 family)